MQTMSVSPPRPLTGEERAQMRKWLDTWREAGPLLEAERWRRLQNMSDADRALMSLDLLSLWQSDRPGDDGEALVRVQRAFAVWRKKHG